MRSPYPSPGRNTRIENIWNSIVNFTRAAIQGSQRPLARQLYTREGQALTALDREYDIEIEESIVRGGERTRLLCEMIENSHECALAVMRILDATFSSSDGDDVGWSVAPTLNDNEEPIDPEVYRILNRLNEEVLGGSTLKPIGERMLNFGDGFLPLGVNPTEMRIERIMLNIPTFEMFRIETNQEELLGFEQRRYITDQNPIRFHPLFCVHFCYRRKRLYGRSLFNEVLNDWQRLKAADLDLTNGSLAIGVNPNIHTLPPDWTEKQVRNYVAATEEARRHKGAITDYYFKDGQTLAKLSDMDPSLDALIAHYKLRSDRIKHQSQVPPYLLGMESKGGQELSEQPAKAFARFINSFRMDITAGIRHICNLELALHGIPKEEWRYRIIWPKAFSSVLEQQVNPSVEESNDPAIADLDAIFVASESDSWVGDDNQWNALPVAVRSRLVESFKGKHKQRRRALPQSTKPHSGE